MSKLRSRGYAFPWGLMLANRNDFPLARAANLPAHRAFCAISANKLSEMAEGASERHIVSNRQQFGPKR